MKKIKLASMDKEVQKKCLLVLVSALLCVLFSMPTLMALIEPKAEMITITVKDGKLESTNETVVQDDAEGILEQLDMGLGQYDYMNVSEEEILEDGDLLQIYRVSYDTSVETEAIAASSETHHNGYHLFNSVITRQAVDGVKELEYVLQYQNGEVVEKTLVDETIVEEPVNEIISVGKVQPGAYFSGRLTTYGSDCYGCSGNTAAGVRLESLGKPTYTYNGQEYYILAADRSIPFYSIIKISNHQLDLPSTIYGIVLDRGGAIRNGAIDIYVGKENGERYFSGSTSYNTQFEIVSVGR